MDKIERRKFSLDERRDILVKTKCKCAHCGKTLTEYNMTVEHITPIDKGGNHDEFNLIALCEDCNNEKSNWTYGLPDYYKFISREYFFSYANYMYDNLKYDRLFPLDATLYHYIPYNTQAILAQMNARGANKKKMHTVLFKSLAKIKLEKAFEGDAADIFNLIDRMKDRCVKGLDMSMYDNEYKIRNLIRYGESYVLRSDNELCGAFMFKRLRENEIDFIQLHNISEETRLRQKYIMIMSIVSNKAVPIYGNVMTDITLHNMAVGSIPMYFNSLESIYTKNNNIIAIPGEIDNIPGKIESFTISELKSIVIEELNARKDDEEIKEIFEMHNLDSEKATDLYLKPKKLCEDDDEYELSIKLQKIMNKHFSGIISKNIGV